MESNGVMRQRGRFLAAAIMGAALLPTFATEPVRAPAYPTAPAAKAQSDTYLGEIDEVDVLVGYTGTVASRRGRGLQRFIEELIDYTNAAFERSRVSARLRLVGTHRTSYRENGNSDYDLAPLTDPSYGHADDLHRRRDELGADLVVLLVHNHPDEACGISHLLDSGYAYAHRYAFAVVAHQWAARGSIDRNWESCFAHEVAHLFGAQHQPEVSTHPQAPYAHAYCRTGSPRFRTIVAYNRGCPTPTGHFSNPDVRWRGHPTGDADQRDNARWMNILAPQLAAFRERADAPPEPNRIVLSWHAISPTRAGATGFVRLENLTQSAGDVDVRVIDDRGEQYPPVTLRLQPRQVRSLRLADIADDIGPTHGAGNLHAITHLEIRAAAYAYGPGWLTRTDLQVPATSSAHLPGVWLYRPQLFNPGSNTAKRSVLRLFNTMSPADVTVTLIARDDAGEAGDASVDILVSAGYAPTLVTARHLEEAGWGDGRLKWRREIRSPVALHVINVIHGNSGYVASLP